MHSTDPMSTSSEQAWLLTPQSKEGADDVFMTRWNSLGYYEDYRKLRQSYVNYLGGHMEVGELGFGYVVRNERSYNWNDTVGFLHSASVN